MVQIKNKVSKEECIMDWMECIVNEIMDKNKDQSGAQIKKMESTLTMESYLRLCGRQYNYVVVTYMTP